MLCVCRGGGQAGRLLRGKGEGGLGPKNGCTNNGPARFSLLFFPPWSLWCGRGGVGFGGKPPPLVFNYSKDALVAVGGGGGHLLLVYGGQNGGHGTRLSLIM